MIIDSPIISGSYAATGSLNQVGNVTITGSLTVTGPIVGALTGSVDSASFASTASFVRNAVSSSFATTASFATFAALANQAASPFVSATTNNIDYGVTFALSATPAYTTLYRAAGLTFNPTSSLTRATNLIATGSLLGTSSFANNTTSASYAVNTSFLNGLGSEQFVPTGSFNTFSSSILTYTESVNSQLSALQITSGSNITRISALETASGSAILRLSSLESKTGSYATTGSNTFVGGQYFSSSFNPTGFTTTASLYTDGGLRVTRDAYISGTLYLNNVTVYGTQSISYISSSQLNIGTNIISVNTDTPSVRFGGLAVYDSGSTGLTGSILWDSQNNHWVYSNPSGSSYSGGMFISGPRTATLGSETGTTSCMLLAGQGGDHLTSSMIYHDSNATCIPNTLAGGIACFSGQVCGNGATFTTTGNTAVTIASGATGLSRLIFQGTVGNARGFVDYDNSTCGFIIRTNENTALTISNVGAAIFSNALQVAGQQAALNYGGTGLNFDFTSGNVGRIASVKTTSGGSSLEVHTYNTSGADVTALTINSNGISCFACQVCAPQLSLNSSSQQMISAVGSNTGGTTILLQNTSTGGDCWRIFSTGAANGEGAGHMLFNNSTGVKMIINSSGSVGIGTTSPGLSSSSDVVDLTVSKSGGATNVGALNLQGDRSGDGGSLTRIGTINFWQTTNNIARINGLRYGANNSGGISFETNNAGGGLTQRMVLDPTGDLGLGITPSAWTTQGPAIQIGAQGAIAAIQYASNNNQVSIANNAYVQQDTAFYYIASNPAGLLRIVNSGEFQWMQAGTGTANAQISFNRPMTLSADGNLSIGNTNNDYKLDVTGTGMFRTTSTNPAIRVLLPGNANATILSSVDPTGFGWQLQQEEVSTGDFRIFRRVSSVDYQVLNLARATGAATFSSSVTAGGLYTFSEWTSGTVNKIRGFCGNDDKSIQWAFNNSPAGTLIKDNNSFLLSINGANTLFANTTGVGIGTTSPSSTYCTLTVAGTGISIADDGNAKLQIGRYSSTACNAYIKMGANACSLRFTNNTDLADVVVMEKGGNVGIGTSSPTARLHVGDGSQTAINGAGNKIHIATTGTRSALLTLANSSGGTTVEGQFESSAESADLRIIIGSTTNHDVVFRTNNAERMRITNSGTIQPGANGTQDLGTSSLRWATVFTSDLSLSNGIGDYTIVEGENDLFLYNNKQCKVYRFMLEQVCAECATPKKS